MVCTFRETGPKQTGNLLDKCLGGEEGVILLCEFFNEFFVFVQSIICLSKGERTTLNGKIYALLQIIDGQILEVDLLSTIDVGSVCENADRHARPRDIR